MTATTGSAGLLARWSCPQCAYSAAPNEILSVRSHFDAHSLECVRCLYRTETKATWKEAEAAYRLAAKPAEDVREAVENIEMAQSRLRAAMMGKEPCKPCIDLAASYLQEAVKSLTATTGQPNP